MKSYIQIYNNVNHNQQMLTKQAAIRLGPLKFAGSFKGARRLRRFKNWGKETYGDAWKNRFKPNKWDLPGYRQKGPTNIQVPYKNLVPNIFRSDLDYGTRPLVLKPERPIPYRPWDQEVPTAPKSKTTLWSKVKPYAMSTGIGMGVGAAGTVGALINDSKYQKKDGALINLLNWLFQLFGSNSRFASYKK